MVLGSSVGEARWGIVRAMHRSVGVGVREAGQRNKWEEHQGLHNYRGQGKARENKAYTLFFDMATLF